MNISTRFMVNAAKTGYVARNTYPDRETIAGFRFIDPSFGVGFNQIGNSLCQGYDDMGNIIEPSWVGMG